MSDPIVDPSDLATYLGIEVDGDRALAMLSYAQTLCESIVSPLPAGAAVVVLDVAARGFNNPAQYQSANEPGGFGVQYGPVSGGMWLTRQNKATLRRLNGGGGAFMIDPTPADAVAVLPPWDGFLPETS